MTMLDAHTPSHAGRADAAAAALLSHRARLRERAASTPATALPHAVAVLPPEQLPREAREAYAIQDALIRRLGAVAGWKVGGARAPVPNCAPVFAHALWPDATAVPWPLEAATEYECEIAFTFARDLPGCGRPYDETEVADAVGATRAAIEILDARMDVLDESDRWVALADGLGCAGLVVGEPVAGWREVDCAAQSVRLRVDDLEVLAGQGGNLATRLLPLLTWLANHLVGRGLPLRAGQTVTTGSWTGVRTWGAARHVEADFEGIGRVHLRAG